MTNEAGQARCLAIGLSVCLRRLRKALPAAALVFGVMCLGWGAGKLAESYGFFPGVLVAPDFGWESLVFGVLVAAPLTFISLLLAWVYLALLELGQEEIGRRANIQAELDSQTANDTPPASED